MRLGMRAPQLRRFEQQFHDAPVTTAREMRAGMETSGRVLRDAVRYEAHPSFQPFIGYRIYGVGGNLRTEVVGDTKAKPHMFWQNWGTSTRRVLGARPPYHIYPRFATVLRFIHHGRVVFAKYILNHPGIFAKLFFRRGYQAAMPKIRRILGGHLGNITKSLKSNGS